MRYFIIALMGMMAFGLDSASAQKVYISENETPKQILSYVNTYLPNLKIKEIERITENNKVEYKIKLSRKTEVEFDGNSSVKDVTSKREIPKSVLPPKIREYMDDEYPDNQIIEWEVEDDVQKVKLSKKDKVYFDLEGNFLQQKFS